MSTATPLPPAPSSPASRPAPAAPRPAAGGGAPAMSGFANIDPIKLLRRYWPLLAGASVFGAVLGTAAHFALLRLYPTWTASSTFQCFPPRTNPMQIRGTDVQQNDFDRFMGTQLAIMLSPDVLGRAVKSPDLTATTWAKQFIANGNFQSTRAITKLQDKLAPRLVPQTTLIKLQFSCQNRDDSRAVVEAVTQAYLQSVRQANNETSGAQRQVLDDRRSAITSEISQKNKQRSTILEKSGITNLKDGASAEEQKQAQQTKDLVEADQQVASVKAMLKRLDDAAHSKGVIDFPQDMVEEAKTDSVILELKRDISQMQVSEQSLLQQGYKESHPTLVSLRQRLLATQAQKDDEMKRVLQRMYDARVEDYSRSIESTEARRQKLFDDLQVIQTRKQSLLKAVSDINAIDDDIKQLNQDLTEVNAARQNLETLNQSSVFDQVKLVIPAQTPTEVAFPKLVIMLPLGVLLITGLTATVVLLREIMDQRVKGPADVAMIPRLKVLGMIPDAAEDPARPATIETAFRDTPGGVVTESFRQVRAPLVKKMDSEGLRSVLVLAGMPGSGGTSVACNLAIACASSDDRVLIIDANVRRPALQRVFGISEPLGLADCLAGQAALSEVVRATNVPNLSVLTAGTPGNRMVPERLSSDAMTRLLAEAAGKFDRVFVDCPPAIVSGDGMALANRTDAVVMVVRALNEKRGLVNRIRSQLGEARAELIGVVVNGVKSSAGGYFKRNIQATHEYHNTAST